MELQYQVEFESPLNCGDLFTRLILPSTYQDIHSNIALGFSTPVKVGSNCCLSLGFPWYTYSYSLVVNAFSPSEYFFEFLNNFHSFVRVQGVISVRRGDTYPSKGIFDLKLVTMPAVWLARKQIKDSVDKMLPDFVGCIAQRCNTVQ